MSIEQSIRVLFVENREEDAELAASTLKNGGLDVICERVETEKEYLAALTESRPDIIISDYSMPQFDGMRALEIWLERSPDLPFLVLTGSVNEETAVACMKAGATDYVLKEQMGRLPFAVKEALAKYQTLKQKQVAEEALRSSERVYRLLADSMNDAIWLYDLASEQFTYISPSVTRVLGYSVDAFAQKSLEDVVAPEDRARLGEELSTRLAAFCVGDETNRVRTMELSQIRADGSSVPTEMTTALIVGPDGRVTQVQGITRDITERKLAERATADALAFNRAIVENSTMGLLTFKTTGECISANQAAARMVGGSVEQLKRLNFHHIESWKTSGLYEAAERAMATGDMVQTEVEITTTFGVEASLLSKLSLFQIGGEPHLMVMFDDLTSHRRAEIALRESEARLRSLVDSAPDGILVHSGGIVQFANTAMVRLVGVASAEELIGTSIMEFIAPEDREPAQARVVAYADTDVPGPLVEEYLLRRDGSKVAVEATDVRYVYGGQQARLVFIRDRSERYKAEEERRALEEQLQHAQKMESVGVLAGGVAHDFNNILMVQKGYCELMRADLHLEAPVLDGLTQIEACADRATTLTRQLLAFSRKQVMQPVVLDLNLLLEDMDDMLRRVVGEGIDLQVRLGAKATFVKADPMQLEQVLVNLAANARDAMPEGGSLCIQVTSVALDPRSASCLVGAPPGPNVVIAVSDVGIGMDAETKQRIFEPFFTTKSEGKGTGLGLSTVYGIVQQSGGSVSVDTEPGKGTTFRIFLPQVQDLPLPDATDDSAIPSGRGELILVVEDEPVLRGLVQLMVESLGYRAKVAANGAEAKALILEDGLRPDLLLSDVVMPGMSGAALVEELRRTISDLRFIFMSGYPDSAIARHRIPNTAFDFLQKPFSIRDLGNKIESVLGPTATASNEPEVQGEAQGL